MGIATDDGHTGQGSALLWANYMYDALARVVDLELLYTEFLAVFIQCDHLGQSNFVGYASKTLFPVRRRHVVVWCREVGIHAPQRSVRQLQALKGLR